MHNLRCTNNRPKRIHFSKTYLAIHIFLILISFLNKYFIHGMNNLDFSPMPEISGQWKTSATWPKSWVCFIFFLLICNLGNVYEKHENLCFDLKDKVKYLEIFCLSVMSFIVFTSSFLKMYFTFYMYKGLLCSLQLRVLRPVQMFKKMLKHKQRSTSTGREGQHLKNWSR